MSIINPATVRFSDAPWAKHNLIDSIVVGGAGGIGSWLTLLLARTYTAPIIVFDADRIEMHNLGGQLFTTSSVNTSKVDEVAKIARQFCSNGRVITPKASMVGQETRQIILFREVCFSAFDNMAARKTLFQFWLDSIELSGKETPEDTWEVSEEPEYYDEINPEYFLFVDGRLNPEQMQIFCIRGSDKAAIKKYQEEFLFDDSDVEDLPCTFKQTSHSAAMIASHMVGFYTNHLTNIIEEDDDRVVPFMWEYHIPLNLVTEIQKV